MTDAANLQKDAWIEPEIQTLDVSETSGFPNRGGDGNRFIDCTRS